MDILGAYYLLVCVYRLCLLPNKTCDLTSLQVRWKDCSQMWNGVRQVYLQTAVHWSKLWSLCRRILLLPSVHPYDFSSILAMFSVLHICFHSYLPLMFKNYESFYHLLPLDWLTWILDRPLTAATTFKPCIVSLSGSYVNSQRLNYCCNLTGVSSVHIMSHSLVHVRRGSSLVLGTGSLFHWAAASSLPSNLSNVQKGCLWSPYVCCLLCRINDKQLWGENSHEVFYD